MAEHGFNGHGQDPIPSITANEIAILKDVHDKAQQSLQKCFIEQQKALHDQFTQAVKNIQEDHEQPSKKLKNGKLLNSLSISNTYNNMPIQSTTSNNYLIKINVGGHIYSCTRETLCVDHESMLAAMFCGRHTPCYDQDGNYFIDRNGELFGYILEYLRSGSVQLTTPNDTQRLIQEADYFYLKGLYEQLVPPPVMLHGTGLSCFTSTTNGLMRPGDKWGPWEITDIIGSHPLFTSTDTMIEPLLNANVVDDDDNDDDNESVLCMVFANFSIEKGSIALKLFGKEMLRSKSDFCWSNGQVGGRAGSSTFCDLIEVPKKINQGTLEFQNIDMQFNSSTNNNVSMIPIVSSSRYDKYDVPYASFVLKGVSWKTISTKYMKDIFEVINDQYYCALTIEIQKTCLYIVMGAVFNEYSHGSSNTEDKGGISIKVDGTVISQLTPTRRDIGTNNVAFFEVLRLTKNSRLEFSGPNLDQFRGDGAYDSRFHILPIGPDENYESMLANTSPPSSSSSIIYPKTSFQFIKFREEELLCRENDYKVWTLEQCSIDYLKMLANESSDSIKYSKRISLAQGVFLVVVKVDNRTGPIEILLNENVIAQFSAIQHLCSHVIHVGADEEAIFGVKCDAGDEIFDARSGGSNMHLVRLM